MKINIIPEPQHIEIQSENAVFTLTRLAEVAADKGSEKALASFYSFCKKAFEMSFVGTGRQSVTLCVSDGVTQKEGYRLTVQKDSVLIEGADEAGVFWGVQTLCSLLFQNERSLCALSVYDYPKTKVRAFMLDCSSWFFTPEAVKLFLDAMALHKLNVFHWRLSGDCGFRLELFENYLLTQIGGYRAFTGLGRIPHGGYYTRQDTEDILRYAEERFITVVPELDVPDRATAAIAAYPFLSCDENQVYPATTFCDQSTVLCLGKESTYDFMFSVIDEVSEVFHGGLVHLGGEKSKKADRRSCPHCEEKRLSLPNQSSEALYSYFFNRLARYAAGKGMKVIIREKQEDFAKTNDSNLDTENQSNLIFFDSSLDLSRSYSDLSVKECYEFLNEKENTTAEAALWTQNASDMKKAGVLLFPRLGAFSESVWTREEKRDWTHFLQKLDDYNRALAFLPFDAAKKRTAFPGALRSLGSKIKKQFLKG